MPPALVLPATQASPIPDDEFVLRVAADTRGCEGPLPRPLVSLMRCGLRTSLVQLLVEGSLYYANRTVKLRRDESLDDARVRKQWQELEDFEPRVESRAGGQPRLVINAPAQGEESAPISKLLGEAVTLRVAQEITKIPLRSWVPKIYQAGVRHDLEANTRQGLVIAEARGRYNGKNVGNALAGIRRKFSGHFGTARPTHTQAIGVVYNLRSDADDSQVGFDHDVIVADPEMAGLPPSDVMRWRALLVHYILVLRRQGVHILADELVPWLDVPDRALRRQVASKLPIVPPPLWRAAILDLPEGRLLQLGDDHERYLGVSMSWHERFAGQKLRGAFLGLHKRVLDALFRLSLDDIETMAAPRWVGSRGRFRYVRMDDGALFAFGT